MKRSDLVVKRQPLTRYQGEVAQSYYLQAASTLGKEEGLQAMASVPEVAGTAWARAEETGEPRAAGKEGDLGAPRVASMEADWVVDLGVD